MTLFQLHRLKQKRIEWDDVNESVQVSEQYRRSRLERLKKTTVKLSSGKVITRPGFDLSVS